MADDCSSPRVGLASSEVRLPASSSISVPAPPGITDATVSYTRAAQLIERKSLANDREPPRPCLVSWFSKNLFFV